MPNAIDVRQFDFDSRTPGPLRVSLVSVATERKGFRGFIEVARLLESGLDAAFVFIGPRSELTDQMQAAGSLPSNVAFAGYASNPAEAMRQVDILVNLSTCYESFGRMALEAMAARLPVVAFARGALPELVRDGETGFLVPCDDLPLAARRIEQLVRDSALRGAMGNAGHRVAEEHFPPRVLAKALRASYRAILPSRTAREQSANDLTIALPSINNSQFRDQFYVGNRARFAHCSTVKFIDGERLVCASLIGQRMYLVRFDMDRGASEIVSAIHTSDGRRDVSVELIDFDGIDRLLSANCEHSSLSLYRLTDTVITFVESIGIGDPEMGFCHGAKFVLGRPDLVCAATNTGRCDVVFLSLETRRPVGSFYDHGWLPKDLAFVDARRMVVVSRRGNAGLDPHVPQHSKVALVDLDDALGGHRIVDEAVLSDTTVDGCNVHDGTLYVADQANDAVLAYDIKDGRLRRLADLEGFSFPHGVDVSADGTLLAVANYGPNVITVRRLS